MTTTIKIHEETKGELDQLREYKNESYDEILKKMVFIAKNIKNKPELSKETILAIEKNKYTPSLALSFRIARVFGVGIEKVFYWRD